jgi:hypothetical protein
MSVNGGAINPLNQAALSNALRRVWVDYVSWMTALIYTIMFGTHDQSAVETRLRQNAEDYAGIFAQFYGDAVGARLRSIFVQFQEEMAQLIQAYKANDITDISDRRQALYALGEELAMVLSQLNPYWDEASLEVGLYEMINQFEDEIVHIIRQEFEQSIEAYDRLLAQAYQTADEMTYGLQRQFRS